MEIRVVSALVGASIALLLITMLSVMQVSGKADYNKARLDDIHSQVTTISSILSNAEITN